VTEQRSDERFGAGLQVLLSWHHNGTPMNVQCTAKNISDGGAALTSKASPLPAVGETVTVRVANPAGGQVPTLSAKVVHHTEDGLGVAFLGPS